MNIGDLTVYSDNQLHRLQIRLHDLYKKHFNREDLKLQMAALELELENRGLEVWELAEG